MSKFDQLIREEKIRANEAAEIENAKLAEEKRKEQEFQEFKERCISKIKEYLVDLNDLFPKVKGWKDAHYYTDFLSIKRHVRYLDLMRVVVTEKGDFYEWVDMGRLTGPLSMDKAANRIFVGFRYEYNDKTLLSMDVDELVRQYFAKALEGKV